MRKTRAENQLIWIWWDSFDGDSDSLEQVVNSEERLAVLRRHLNSKERLTVHWMFLWAEWDVPACFQKCNTQPCDQTVVKTFTYFPGHRGSGKRCFYSTVIFHYYVDTIPVYTIISALLKTFIDLPRSSLWGQVHVLFL